MSAIVCPFFDGLLTYFINFKHYTVPFQSSVRCSDRKKKNNSLCVT